MFPKLFAEIALFGLLLVGSANTYAVYDQWRINEVFSNADGTVQFIKMKTTVSGQQFLRGATISSAQGGVTKSFVFDTAPNDGSNYSPPKTFLIGTVGFAALAIVNPDYIVPNGFIFSSNMTINFAGVDIVSFTSIPTDGYHSVDRNGITAANSPTNFAGFTGTVYPPLPGAPNIGSAAANDSQASVSFNPG